MICLPISADTPEKLLAAVRECGEGADLLEIRLDFLERPEEADIAGIAKAASLPLICTCRHGSEGGKWHGEEKRRIKILKNAAVSGATYIDVELISGPDVLRELRETTSAAGCKLIVSFHDFSGTPARDSLLDVMLGQQNAGADIGKIVVMAKSPRDVAVPFSIYHVADRADFPLVAFSMGEPGRISRVACLAMGAPFTFAAPDTGAGTAPGQITVSEMRRLVKMLLTPR
jgi:3-dehydroquinate dehydratase type I